MNDDPSFRMLFRTALRADEKGAPDFDRLWSAASGRHHRQRTRVRLAQISAVAALLLIVAFVSIRKSSPTRESTTAALPWRSVVLLSEWRAPTDTLLSSMPESDSFSLDLHH